MFCNARSHVCQAGLLASKRALVALQPILRDLLHRVCEGVSWTNQIGYSSYFDSFEGVVASTHHSIQNEVCTLPMFVDQQQRTYIA
jgi:hypothetical protein